MDRRSIRQRGSSSFVALVSMGALSTLYIVQSTIFKENANSIERIKVENTIQDNNRDIVNGISVAKALLYPKRQGSTESIPALFAVNYYESTWNMTGGKNKTANFELKSDPRNFAVSLPYAIAPDHKNIASIMDGSQSFFDHNPPKAINFLALKTNFDVNGREAVSIDIQTKANGKSPTNARISLAPAEPFDIKLQYRKIGESDWHSDPASLEAADYEFRVLASGIAFDGEAYLNGIKISEFGGFDPSGKIRHKAVSYSSVDEEIGRFTHSFDDRNFDPTTCTASTSSGANSLSIVVNGPAGTIETKKDIAANFQVIPALQPKELSYDEFMSSCMDQCPYLAPPEEVVVDGEKYKVGDRDTAWKNRNYGDFTNATLRDFRRFDTKLADVRLCHDDHKLAEAFKTKNGRYYDSNADYYATPGWEEFSPLSDFLTYKAPACKPKFLFTRNACGCFDENTKIRLGNNIDEKPISELSSEDTVWNPILKKAFRIRKMVRGPEKIPMISIATLERSISVTHNHPMLTPRGIIAAHELSDDDEVRIDGDSWSRVLKVSELSSEGQEPIVWNLELESTSDDDDSHFVMANGIITGDLFIQNKLEKDKK